MQRRVIEAFDCLNLERLSGGVCAYRVDQSPKEDSAYSITGW